MKRHHRTVVRLAWLLLAPVLVVLLALVLLAPAHEPVNLDWPAVLATLPGVR